MNKTVLLTAALLLLNACSTMTPARYAASADNNQALRLYEGSQIQIAQMTPPESYSPNCRLMGPIQAADGETIPEFVRKAFNDEFKFASIYSESGVALRGEMTRIEFSSTAGLTNGWWELGVVLTAPNGKTLQASSRTDFKSGFDAVTACNQTAQALGGAVQDLIKATVTDPRFAELIK